MRDRDPGNDKGRHVTEDIDRPVDHLPASADPRAAALYARWQSLCVDGLPPDRQRLDVFALQPWLGYISIYAEIDGGADFRVRLEGTRITQMTGEDWTGRTARQVDETFGSELLPIMQGVLRERRPAIHITRIYQREFRSAIRLLLPMRSRPDGPVDQVFMVIYPDPEAAD